MVEVEKFVQGEDFEDVFDLENLLTRYYGLGYSDKKKLTILVESKQ